MKNRGNNVRVDSGLNRYMARIYGYMALGLGVTAFVAYLPQLMSFHAQRTFYSLSSLSWIGSFGIAIYFSAALQRMRVQTAQVLFWVYSVLMGVSLSNLFRLYHSHSIAQTFMITSFMFAGMSLYGHMTKRDLSGLGSFAMMGLWGVILASVVNIFLGSAGIDFVLSVAGVVIFTSLIAYDVQALQSMYYAMPHQDGIRDKMSILGALKLYMDVINLFVSLLRLTGDRK